MLTLTTTISVLLNLCILLVLILIIIMALSTKITAFQWIYIYIFRHEIYERIKFIMEHGIIHYFPSFDEWYNSEWYKKGYCLVCLKDKYDDESYLALYDNGTIAISPFYNKILRKIERKLTYERNS